ncbi:Methyltransferase domain-containing protein [Cyclonatronum proteinivorum]|uniref:Methyltransferase domain-containing protein n=1 Tax=Cyclonatronum proteinivorum TaxID=1457365 RepID=A0A345UP81_9BACT|nr:class I SAM-dependent methyltransferase [Cyclonatronum proteinivorum]AXJ02283.1 Methyltransferase domain-containing protein [Cyclonatronum proteinivorum]
MTQPASHTDGLTLKHPLDERHFYHVPAAAARLQERLNGDAGCATGDTIGIRDNIIEYLPGKPSGITPAQQSNFLTATAQFYEDSWRKRSIGILSGEDFSFEDERELLLQWAQPKAGELVLDLGCSTGFYARSIKAHSPNAQVVAIDFSAPMLDETRNRALAAGTDLYLLKADVSRLPFYAQSADLLVCGGSLNEFRSPAAALHQMRRVIKDDGRLFMMHLLRADTFAGSLAQKASGVGGISFWSETESLKLFNDHGFRVEKSRKLGIVYFSLLRPE